MLFLFKIYKRCLNYSIMNNNTKNYINKNNLTILTMIDTIKVSSKGQIVIPELIRKRLNIQEGTKMVVIERDNKLILELEEDFLKKIEEMEIDKEKIGWLKLAEKGMGKIWDNDRDEEIWKMYL